MNSNKSLIFFFIVASLMKVTKLNAKNVSCNQDIVSKIEQMLFINGPISKDHNKSIKKLINKHPSLGGVYFYGSSFSSMGFNNLSDISRYLEDFKSHFQTVPFITMDYEEAPKVRRLAKYPMRRTLSPKEIGLIQNYDPEIQISKIIGQIHGKQLKALGFNLNLAPVADTNKNIKEISAMAKEGRIYHEDEQVVSEVVCGYIEGIQSCSIGSTVKHFPNIGDTEIDTHLPQRVIIKKSWEELTSEYIVPFLDAFNEKPTSVMFGAVECPLIDEQSPEIYKSEIFIDTFREESGYEGLIITDGVFMPSILGMRVTSDNLEIAKEKAVNIIVDMFLAGIDMPLTLTISVDDIISKLCGIIEEGGEKAKTLIDNINKSNERIKTQKKKLGLGRKGTSSPIITGAINKVFQAASFDTKSYPDVVQAVLNYNGNIDYLDIVSLKYELPIKKQVIERIRTSKEHSFINFVSRIYQKEKNMNFENISIPHCQGWKNFWIKYSDGQGIEAGFQTWNKKFRSGEKVEFPSLTDLSEDCHR